MKWDIFYYLYWDAWRFFKALFTGKELKVDKEEAIRRLSICNGCPNLKKEARFFWYKKARCGICGCYIDLKKWLAMEDCPDEPSKWKQK